MSSEPLVLWFSDIRRRDIGTVGGKNASLGEMIGQLKGAGIRVPSGFATTTEAYWGFIAANKLEDKIRDVLADLEEVSLSKTPSPAENLGFTPGGEKLEIPLRIRLDIARRELKLR